MTDDESLGNTQFYAAATTLDDVLTVLAPPGAVRLLKIDVEGFELPVFQGLDFGGAYRPANVIMECDPDGFHDASACFDFFRSKGYDAHTIDGEIVRDCQSLPEMNVWFRERRA